MTEIAEHEVLFAHLDQERVIWLEARHRATRAGHFNAELNQAENEAMERIDNLLDVLSCIATREVVNV